MAISKDEVIRIAGLARLELTEAEVDKFSVELSRILDYVDQLNELDTTAVSPTLQVTGLVNRWREDEVKDEYKRDDMLSTVSDVIEGHVKVPNIFKPKS